MFKIIYINICQGKKVDVKFKKVYNIKDKGVFE